MRTLRHTVAVWLTLFAVLTARAEPTLDVSVNRDRIYLGESFLLVVKVGGSTQPGEPDLFALKDCRIEALGAQNINQTFIHYMNGQVRREGFVGRTYTYKLTPARAGDFHAGPVTVVVDGVTLTRPGPTVTVTGITRQDLVSIAVLASRDAVLVDEPFDIKLVVRIRCLPGAYATVDPLLPSEPPNLNVPFLGLTDTDGLKAPDIRALLNTRVIGGNQAGFAINDYTVQNNVFDFDAFFNNRQPTAARFRLDRQDVDDHGHPCFEYSLTLSYSAQSEGAYTFGPVVFKGNVPTSVNGRGQAHSTEIFAVGPAAIVRVVPPPEENRPDSYIGAIGSNLTVTAALDAQTCNVGDPLKLTLTVAGAVQMQNIGPPKLGSQTNLVTQFEVYDDTVQTSRQSDSRAYTYTLRPRQAGAMELPPVEVSYYDVRDRHYRTVTTLPIPLKVRQAAEVTASQVIGGSTNAPARLRASETVLMQPAGMRLDPQATEPARLMDPLPTLGVAAAGPLVFGAASLLLYLYRHRSAFARARRRRRALSGARRMLRQDVPNAAVCHALRRYLTDRLDQPADAATPEEARALLIAQGIDPALAARFSGIMQGYFDAAFLATPSATADVSPALAVLTDVERALARRSRRGRGKPPVTSAGVGMACALVFLLALPCVLRADPAAEREFIWSEARSQMTSAQAPADYLAAAVTYQKLIDRGILNATVLYNQGTALLLAGKYAEAVQVLHRAERYAGASADIQRNLAIAEGRLEGLKTPVTPWQRIPLFWHYGLACTTRGLVAAGAFALLWIGATLRLLGARTTGRTLMATALVIFLLFGASVLTSLQQESQTGRPTALIGLD